MRWVLTGGGVVADNADRPPAVRPGAGVVERTVPRPAAAPQTVRRPVAERLAVAKLVVEVLAGVVGLVAAVLALFGGSRR